MTYILNNKVKELIDKHWPDWLGDKITLLETTTAKREYAFLQSMRTLQIDLINHYYPTMSDKVKARASKTLSCLEGTQTFWE